MIGPRRAAVASAARPPGVRRARTELQRRITTRMVTAELGACEWFVYELRRSNLIDRGQLDQLVGDYLKRHPRADPPALAQHLIGQGALTQFQADRVLTNKSQGLVLGPYILTDALGAG